MQHYTREELDAWLRGERMEQEEVIYSHIQECVECAGLLDLGTVPNVDLPYLEGTSLLVVLVRPGLKNLPAFWPRGEQCKWALVYGNTSATLITVDTSTHQLTPRVNPDLRQLLMLHVNELVRRFPTHSIEVGIGRGFISGSGLILGPISDELEKVLQAQPSAPGALHWFAGENYT